MNHLCQCGALFHKLLSRDHQRLKDEIHCCPRDELLVVTVVRATVLRCGNPDAVVVVRVDAGCGQPLQTRGAVARSPEWNDPLEFVRTPASDAGTVRFEVNELRRSDDGDLSEYLLAEKRVELRPPTPVLAMEDTMEFAQHVRLSSKAELDIRVRFGPIVKPEAKYDAGEKLGSGAHSVVYDVTERTTGQHYAAKVIQIQSQSVVYKQGLAREISIMRGLDHENIIRLHEVFHTVNRVVLVLERAAGGDLFHEIVRRKRYAEADARPVFRQLARAVEHLHSHGIAHRDLKPENVLLTSAEDPVVKLADFGLAVDTNVNQMAWLAGSPCYVAPEVVQGQHYTTQCDLWSLGVILFVMLSGCVPFWSPDRAKLNAMILHRPIPLDSDNWKGVSPEESEMMGHLSRRLAPVLHLLSECLQPRAHEGSDAQSELMTVTVVRARMPGCGDSEAPVVVRIDAGGDIALQTRCAPAHSPEWNEPLEFVRASASDSRSVSVKLVEMGHADGLLTERVVAPVEAQHEEFEQTIKLPGKVELDVRVKIGPILKPESKYELEEKLGEGAHSCVFDAVERTTGQHYAAKIVHRELQTAADKLGLAREISIMRGLDHDNIVRLHEVFQTKGRVVLIMERVPGGDLLHEIVRRGKFTEEDARPLFRQIVSAVDHLHARGIAHRDLKPENILVTDAEHPCAKLGDFGLAVDTTSYPMVSVAGSPCYVAPEILKLQKYTTQCDVWSLGVILFVMLSGCLPFHSDNRKQLYEMIENNPVPLDNAKLKSISPEGSHSPAHAST
eukprot:m51a1_g694 putative ribosomal protein s6 kinase alpha-4 isoform x1 (785) ;mRNA; f:359385-363612